MDNDNLVARMMAAKYGRSPTQAEIEQHDKTQNDAINTASNVLGSVGSANSPEQAIEESAPSFLDKYRQAVANSKVKQVETPLDTEMNMYKEQAKDAPNFFEKYGAKPKAQPEDSSDIMDKFKKLGEMLNKK